MNEQLITQNRIRTIQELNELVESLHTLGDYNLENYEIRELLLQLKNAHVIATDVQSQNQEIKDIYLIDLPNLQIDDELQLIIFIHNLWVLLQAQHNLNYDSDNSSASISIVPDFFIAPIQHMTNNQQIVNGGRKSRKSRKSRKGKKSKKGRKSRKSRKSRKYLSKIMTKKFK